MPKDWEENEDFNPTDNGFTTAWANDLDETTDLVRLSSDQGQGYTAGENMAYFEANALFSTTHGEDFKLGESRNLEVDNADQAKLTTWTTTDVDGNLVYGAWVFVSKGNDGAAGVEIMSLTLSEKDIDKIIDSVEFDPDA